MRAALPAPVRFDERAVCTGMDPEAFFPIAAAEPITDDVAAACAGCPWRRPCLAWALAHPVVGIWAGTNTAQREDLRRRHGLPRVRATRTFAAAAGAPDDPDLIPQNPQPTTEES